MKKVTVLSAAAAILGALCIGYFILCGTLYSFDMSGLWIWPAFGAILFFGVLWKRYAEPRIHTSGKSVIYKRMKTALLLVFALYMTVFFIFEGILAAYWVSGSQNKDKEADCVIVLGAAVEGEEPGYALGQRILTAYDYLKEHPDPEIIACGGISKEDSVTEADCIKRELVRLGISEDRILVETRSSSTLENFAYAVSLIPEDTDSVAVITSGFHTLRSICTAETVFADAGLGNIELFHISADYSSILLPYSAVREFAAFVSDMCDRNIRIG